MVLSSTYIVISETYNFQIKSMKFKFFEMISSSTYIIISETYSFQIKSLEFKFLEMVSSNLLYSH